MAASDRIVVTCGPCELSMDIPASEFGQAMAAAFTVEHKGHGDASRYCRECKRVHPTISDELAVHGDPPS